MEKVFLIHGWSVRSTQTYQALHLKLAEAGFDLQEIQLGRYVSLDNDIEVRDISRALHNELVRKLGAPPWKGPFHMPRMQWYCWTLLEEMKGHAL